MTDAGRFERGEHYSAAHGVVTHRGVDPVTGLEVLIYDFPGAPTVAPGPAVSEHVLKVLAADARTTAEGERGYLVAAYPSGASLLAPGESAVDDRFVLRALKGLKEAHARGIAHGAIDESRLLYSLGDVYIEGFGVPWRAGPSGQGADERTRLRADVLALADALLALAGDNLSGEVSAALRSARSSNPPMTAERLHAIVSRLAGGAVKVPASGFVDMTLPTVPVAPPSEPQRADRPPEPSHDASPRPAPAAQPQPPSSPRPTPSAAAPPARPVAAARAEDPDPITINSDAGLRPPSQPSPKDSSPGFVKALPPGAKYRHGNVEEGPRPAPIRLDRQELVLGKPRRAWRGPALLLLILLVAGFGAYLAWRERPAEPTAGPNPFPSYLVDVTVEPASMPPVDLIVLRSPSGSRYTEGARLSTVPKNVAFDAAGTWVVYARFLARETPPVTVQVPDDTAVTVVFPPQEE